MREQCENCKYWKVFFPAGTKGALEYPEGENENEGECKRYPPQLDLSEQNYSGDEITETISDWRYWSFPVTMGKDWCGEFKSRLEVVQ